MPDTAEAVAQYGSAVYRLAYAMTRSRSCLLYTSDAADE